MWLYFCFKQITFYKTKCPELTMSEKEVGSDYSDAAEREENTSSPRTSELEFGQHLGGHPRKST